MGEEFDRAHAHERAWQPAPVVISLILGSGGVLFAVATGGFLGWIFAGFLALGAYFCARPHPANPRRLAKAIGAVVGVIVLAFAGVVAVWESGEVVELHSRDEAGNYISTRLWVIDLQGYPSVHSRPSARRTARILANPRVQLVRGGRTECRDAELLYESSLSKDVRQDAARLIEEKYGFRPYASYVLGAMLGGSPEEAILVRLKPCADSE